MTPLSIAALDALTGGRCEAEINLSAPWMVCSIMVCTQAICTDHMFHYLHF